VGTDAELSAELVARRDGSTAVDAALFRTVVDSSPVGLVVIEVDGPVRYVNAAMLRLVRCTRAEFDGFARTRIGEWARPRAAECGRLRSGECDVVTVEDPILRQDGTRMVATIEVRLLRSAVGDARQIFVRVSDVTERHRLAAELRAAEAHYRMLVEKVPAIVYTAEPGPDGRRLYVSPQVERVLGYTAEEWLADPTLWRRLIHPDDVDRVMTADIGHGADGPSPSAVPTTYRMLRADGTTIWVRDAVAVELDGEGRPVYHGVLTDVTAEKALEARLEYMVEHDQLTGLLNAPAFGRRLAGALGHLGEGEAAGVVFVDLDKFKHVNDEYGHGVGDALLRRIGGSLSAAAHSQPGAEAGRIGGDEFVVLLGEADRTGTEQLAARVLVAVQSASVPVGGRIVGVDASVGFAMGRAGDSADSLLSRADRAMYRVKERGGGRVGLTD